MVSELLDPEPCPSISSHHSESSHRNNVVLNPTPITILSPSPSQNSSPESSASVTSSQPTNSESPPPVPHRIHPQNRHSMRTRGKHGIVQPRINPTLLLTHVEPTTYKTAL